MKKVWKSLILGSVLFLCGTFSFAQKYDWSQCWCNFGGGIKEGNVILDIGAGVNWVPNPLALNNPDPWFIPAVEVTLEVPVMIWKLPLSFGGSFSYNAYGARIGNLYTESDHIISSGGLIKYHVQMPVKNLDLYIGTKIGFTIRMRNVSYNDGNIDKYVIPEFYISNVLGASWYFNDVFGVNLEFGHPIAVKASVSFKF